MAMTPDMDTARIERTMRVVEYEDDKPKVKELTALFFFYLNINPIRRRR